MYVCGSEDWYFSIWQLSMPLEFHWQLSNWVGLMLSCRVKTMKKKLEKEPPWNIEVSIGANIPYMHMIFPKPFLTLQLRIQTSAKSGTEFARGLAFSRHIKAKITREGALCNSEISTGADITHMQQHITYRTVIEKFGPQPQPRLWLCWLLWTK